MKRLLLILALAAAIGCESNDATRDEATSATETTAAAQPATMPTETTPTETTPEAANTFGALVDGATSVEIGRREGEASVSIADAAWVTAFLSAVGTDTAADDAVPRCLPEYTITFRNDEADLATFGAVCGGSPDTLILVRDGQAFTAQDPATGLEMIKTAATKKAQ